MTARTTPANSIKPEVTLAAMITGFFTFSPGTRKCQLSYFVTFQIIKNAQMSNALSSCRALFHDTINPTS